MSKKKKKKMKEIVSFGKIFIKEFFNFEFCACVCKLVVKKNKENEPRRLVVVYERCVRCNFEILVVLENEK